MKRLGHLAELDKACIPVSLKSSVEEILKTLDDEYGKDRDIENSLGGFVLYCEIGEKAFKVRKAVNANLRLYEWSREIGNDYTMAHYLLGDDYSVVLVCETRLFNEILKEK